MRNEQRSGSQKMNKIRDGVSRTSLTIILAVFVFAVLISAIGLAGLTLYILTKLGVFSGTDGNLEVGPVILFMCLISLVLGGVLAFTSSRIPLKPINNLINTMNRVAKGDFAARLSFGNALSSHPVFQEITTSFNTMAEELQNTEMLRSDFINNFSHEFKTPIVSIAGFAGLLANADLPEEQRQQYLHAIEEESRRLSLMATNVLQLTKIENQTILTNISCFNLSEQIRSAVLLLENKWEKKELEMVLDFEEHMIRADEELLKEVWINLLDNAVKFTPKGGTISLDIKEEAEAYSVAIGNTGEEIPKEKEEKIFQKFYQADESHTVQGNGIGLAIVKRVVQLHQGEVTVQSEGGKTVFTVTLPKVTI